MYKQLKYLSSFFFPGCVFWFLYSGLHQAVDALLWTLPLWFLILLDWFSPKIEQENSKVAISGWFYDAILYGLAALQFLIIALLLVNASQLQWQTTEEILTSIVNLVVMRILVGTSSGSSAIIVAHELIHRPQFYLRLLGRALLVTVCYEHFVIAHIRGHHLSVATPEDIATARLDESFNDYWKRVTLGHFKYAWKLEQNNLGLEQTPVYHYKMLKNSVLQGVVFEMALLIVIWMVFGWAAALIFLYQALSAVRLLETINYYQHWGLENGKQGNQTAWVNQSSVTKYALIGLSNHIDHHQNASKTYAETVYSDQGPVMPFGYFVTNLWVKLNNESYRKVSADILNKLQ